jgi:hypothetical protein
MIAGGGGGGYLGVAPLATERGFNGDQRNVMWRLFVAGSKAKLSLGHVFRGGWVARVCVRGWGGNGGNRRSGGEYGCWMGQTGRSSRWRLRHAAAAGGEKRWQQPWRTCGEGIRKFVAIPNSDARIWSSRDVAMAEETETDRDARKRRKVRDDLFRSTPY